MQENVNICKTQYSQNYALQLMRFLVSCSLELERVDKGDSDMLSVLLFNLIIYLCIATHLDVAQ